jgi:hypothetical protein
MNPVAKVHIIELKCDALLDEEFVVWFREDVACIETIHARFEVPYQCVRKSLASSGGAHV